MAHLPTDRGGCRRGSESARDQCAVFGRAGSTSERDDRQPAFRDAAAQHCWDRQAKISQEAFRQRTTAPQVPSAAPRQPCTGGPRRSRGLMKGWDGGVREGLVPEGCPARSRTESSLFGFF